MTLNDRIEAFCNLGHTIDELSNSEKELLFAEAGRKNSWFTPPNLEMSLAGIRKLLEPDKLRQWTGRYNPSAQTTRTVGIVMAGNIPMVGFHDFLCVLLSGHRVKAKTSSKDPVLIQYLTNRLIELEPGFSHLIAFEERLNGVDAVIATGSDNTSRYFEYYFRDIPHIIRKNRSSCGIILGEETLSQIEDLGTDIFSYFGLGCRNVSKLFVPEDFEFGKFPASWLKYASITNHSKYVNNYDYNKSIFLINQVPFLDTGYLLITESEKLVSPISVLYFEKYKDQEDLKTKLQSQQDKIQCVVSTNGWYEGSIPMGKAQFPEVWDYADHTDTMKFLKNL